ncbi:cytochrome c oxidase assembly factor 7 homolog [Chelonus insularis]|uniref:cytochrome c oxidase assembly factor 7 homolog n=1 Tax=Chelonus insularis TaxID=460826 RepID=UPI00158854DA|nr:cytochrome c oxidase assembly factor 7 homolog [Chelonus insularis]
MAYNFKNPEDVEAYLKNIYLEYRFSCEGEKDPKACHLLGEYEDAIKTDREKSVNIFKENCDERNWAPSCLKYAGMRAHGAGSEKDLTTAYNYMKKTCDLGNGTGCVRGGIILLMKEFKLMTDRAEQIKLGMEMISKACYKHDVEEGCFQLASIYLGGLKQNVQPNFEEAHKLFLKSCEQKNPYACANLSRMYLLGDGIPKNEVLSEAFKRKAEVLMREMKEYSKQVEFGVTN